jgi:hypothetical protein
MSSYSDSAAYGQVEVYALPDGAEVRYVFGRIRRLRLVPRIIEAERFREAVLDKLEDTADQRFMRRAYSLYSLEDMRTEEQRNTMLARYPQLAEMDIYVLYFEQEFLLEDAEAIILQTGYTFEEMTEDEIAAGWEEPEEESFNITVWLRYTLLDDGLEASVNISDITSPEDMNVIRIELLEFFGAANADEEGYILMPDGSGALLRFGRTAVKQPLRLPIYGNDMTLARDFVGSPAELCSLPIFGIRSGGGSFLCIVTEGAAIGSLNAAGAGLNTAHYAAYPSFEIMQKEIQELSATADRKFNLFEPSPYNGRIAVRYIPLNAGYDCYSAMAEAYRNYLINTDGFPEAQTVASGLALEAYGAIRIPDSILGIPYTRTAALTPYSRAAEIAGELSAAGADSVTVRYVGWGSGGVSQAYAADIKPLGALGGARGLNALFASEAEAFMDVSTQVLTRNGLFDSFSARRDASRRLNGYVATLPHYSLATRHADLWNTSDRYVISPSSLDALADGMLKTFGGSGITAVSLSDAGSVLNSDFRKRRPVNRMEAERLQADFLSKLHNGGLKLMISNANAYALPYTSRVTDVPLSNSRYLAMPETVPFYSMVLSGRIPLYSRPVNGEPDVRAAFLRCIEAGVMPSWRLSDDDGALTKDTHYRLLFNLSYNKSGDLLHGLYTEFKPFFDAFAGRVIVSHDIAAPSVSRTEFEGGIVIYCNHGKTPQEVNGVVMKPQSARLESGR